MSNPEHQAAAAQAVGADYVGALTIRLDIDGLTEADVAGMPGDQSLRYLNEFCVTTTRQDFELPSDGNLLPGGLVEAQILAYAREVAAAPGHRQGILEQDAVRAMRHGASAGGLAVGLTVRFPQIIIASTLRTGLYRAQRPLLAPAEDLLAVYGRTIKALPSSTSRRPGW